MSEYMLAAEQIERVKSIEEAPPAVFDLRSTFSDALGMNMGLDGVFNGSGVGGNGVSGAGVPAALRRKTGAPQSVAHIGGTGAVVGGARGSNSAADGNGPFGLPSAAQSSDENL